MAEENSNQEQEGEAEKGGKKGIIIIAVVVLLAIGVSVGATLFLLGGDEAEPASEDVAEEPEVPAGPMQYQPVTPPILVTFNVDGRQRYMQVHLSIASRNAESLTALNHHMPLIRSRLISTYGGQEFREIQTEAGKLALVETTLTLINEVLESEGESGVEHVYFTNFVLQ